jgi:signal transduction histidine kinase
VVEAHGGTLSVSSAPGKGSTFVVTLPITPGAPTSGPAGSL